MILSLTQEDGTAQCREARWESASTAASSDEHDGDYEDSSSQVVSPIPSEIAFQDEPIGELFPCEDDEACLHQQEVAVEPIQKGKQLESHLEERLREISAAKIVATWGKIYEHLPEAGSASQRLTPFHSSRLPPIRILDYFKRISQYFYCSDACFVLGPLLIDRIGKLHPDFDICKFNIHRLLVISVMLAAKSHDDVYYSNTFYARVAGIPVKEINYLESCFLELLGWRVRASPEEFEVYLEAIYPTMS
jgi:hypothetical protein